MAAVRGPSPEVMVLSALLILFCTFTVVTVPAAIAFGAMTRDPVLNGVILWQTPRHIQPCGSTYSAQAFTMSAYPGASDCPGTWFVLIPPHERGNVTAELSFYSAHARSFAGVIIDDFAPDSYALYSSLSESTKTCAVVYSWTQQPQVTEGGCVVLVIQPEIGAAASGVDGWKRVALRSASTINAARLILLAYAIQYSGWRASLPSGYILGVEEAATSLGAGMVVYG